jgi:hypothetical protein
MMKDYQKLYVSITSSLCRKKDVPLTGVTLKTYHLSVQSSIKEHASINLLLFHIVCIKRCWHMHTYASEICTRQYTLYDFSRQKLKKPRAIGSLPTYLFFLSHFTENTK